MRRARGEGRRVQGASSCEWPGKAPYLASESWAAGQGGERDAGRTGSAWGACGLSTRIVRYQSATADR